MSTKEKEVYEFISQFIKVHGYAPTVREMSNALYVSRMTIHRHITSLKNKGYVETIPRCARTIHLKEVI